MVALLLGALADQARDRRRGLDPLRDEHPLAVHHDVGHDEVGVVAELVGERLLRLGLEPVVELLSDARLQLLDERLDVDTGEHPAERARHPADLPQVGHQRVAGAGVLHLHGHLTTVLPATLVNLADRGGGRRLVVELDELVAPLGAELGGEHVVDGGGRHRGSGVLQPDELVAVGRGHLLGQRGLEHGQRLPELHRAALELTERAEQLLRGALLHLGHHLLRGGTAEPAAHAHGAAAGEPERQRREPRGARDGLAG